MATKKMMQGDSYSVPFVITMNGSTEITPDMVVELELCIGNEDGAQIRKTYTGGGVRYDYASRKWFFRPTQQETFDLEPGSYDAIARMKFSDAPDADIVGVSIGRISITDTQSEEVL